MNTATTKMMMMMTIRAEELSTKASVTVGLSVITAAFDTWSIGSRLRAEVSVTFDEDIAV